MTIAVDLGRKATNKQTHADVSSRNRGLKFCISLHLHPYFEYAINEYSGEPVHRTGSPEPSPLDNAINIKI